MRTIKMWLGQLRLPKLRVDVAFGHRIPAWYGVAWQDWLTHSAICYPIPINLVVAFLRAVYLWMKHGYREVPLDPRDAFNQGFEAGRVDALQHGPWADRRDKL
jgi:hypothetical protein